MNRLEGEKDVLMPKGMDNEGMRVLSLLRYPALPVPFPADQVVPELGVRLRSGVLRGRQRGLEGIPGCA